MLVFLITALKKFTLQKIKFFLNFLTNHLLKKSHFKKIKMVITTTHMLKKVHIKMKIIKFLKTLPIKTF